MKKILTYTFIVVAILYILIYADSKNIKYPTHDCVTYFDNAGRYQLLYVGKSYYLFDAENSKSLCPGIRYYQKEDNKLYLIYDAYIGGNASNPQYEEHYAIFDINASELSSAKSKKELTKPFPEKEKMIKLPLKKSHFKRWIDKFIPLKLRKK